MAGPIHFYKIPNKGMAVNYKDTGAGILQDSVEIIQAYHFKWVFSDL